jgi:hypothetical protein
MFLQFPAKQSYFSCRMNVCRNIDGGCGFFGDSVYHQHADQRDGSRQRRHSRPGFFIIGFSLMPAGCLLLALTGFYVLSFWFN